MYLRYVHYILWSFYDFFTTIPICGYYVNALIYNNITIEFSFYALIGTKMDLVTSNVF